MAASKPSRADIAARAYALWQADGCQAGRDVEYWLRAEKQLIGNSINAPLNPPVFYLQRATPVTRQNKKPATARHAANRRSGS